MNKTDLRKWAKTLRKTLPLEAVSAELVEKIRECDIYRQAKNVMIFYPTEFEVNLLELLEDDKMFYLPKVSGKNLYVCPFEKGDLLEISNLNIYEPCSEPCSPEVLELVIVPALAVDKQGFRLGYGGGFYDRFLAENKVKTILPISGELLLEELPHDSFDIPVDIVISA